MISVEQGKHRIIIIFSYFNFLHFKSITTYIENHVSDKKVYLFEKLLNFV